MQALIKKFLGNPKTVEEKKDENETRTLEETETSGIIYSHCKR